MSITTNCGLGNEEVLPTEVSVGMMTSKPKRDNPKVFLIDSAADLNDSSIMFIIIYRLIK